MQNLSISLEDLEKLGQEILAKDGSFCFIAHGKSMWPFIRNGAQIRISKAIINHLAIGDVVLYKSGNTLAVHRIIEIRNLENKRIFRIRGDGIFDSGEWVPQDLMVGRVIAVRNQGFLSMRRPIQSMLLIEFVRGLRVVGWHVKKRFWSS